MEVRSHTKYSEKMILNIEGSWLLYAEASVEYDGRAYSTLDRGNYIIIHKEDGSLQIHGISLIAPLNYQPPGGKIEILDNKIIARRKKETITINIYNIIHFYKIENWSNNKINIRKTEKEAKEIILSILPKYIPNIKTICEEYKTDYGPVDLLVIDQNNVYHVIEIKRKKLIINNYIQLAKYLLWFKEKEIQYQGYLTGTDIKEQVRTWVEAKGIKIIIYTFPDTYQQSSS